MDEQLKKKVGKAVEGAIEEAARESRGRELRVRTVEVTVKVNGAGGKSAEKRVEVVPDPPPPPVKK